MLMVNIDFKKVNRIVIILKLLKIYDLLYWVIFAMI